MTEGFLPDDRENPEHLRHDLGTIPPSHDPADPPYRCYQINTDYIRFLLAGIDYFVYPDAFIGSDLECLIAAQRMIALQNLLMVGNVDCGEVTQMRLRQSPTNPCQLEQSFDNGASWSLAFDYSLCWRMVVIYDPQQTAQNMAIANANATAIANAYGGDYHEIAPDMHFDSSATDEIRNMAYCFAVQLFISQVAAALGEMEEDGWSVWDITKIVSTVAGVAADIILGVVSATGTPISPIILAATAIVKVVAPVVHEFVDLFEPDPDLGDFLTVEMQADLVCCAMDVIGGMTPDATRFSQMFDTCSEVTIPDVVLLALQAVVNSNEVYLTFLSVIQLAFEAIDGGQVYNCPCATEKVTFEFTTESGSAPNTYYGLSGWQVYPFSAGCFAYLPESGILGDDEVTGEYVQHRGVDMFRGGISGEIRKVTVEFTYSYGVTEAMTHPAFITYGGDQKAYTVAEFGVGGEKTLVRSAYRTLVNQEVGVSVFSDIRYGSNPAYFGTCKIERVIIEGVGLSVS